MSRLQRQRSFFQQMRTTQSVQLASLLTHEACGKFRHQHRMQGVADRINASERKESFGMAESGSNCT